jgi:flagellar FliJ protein
VSTIDLHSLDAVARVRRAREQDSLIGLHQAVTEVGQARQHLAGLEQQLDALAGPAEVGVSDFVTRRSHMLSYGHAITAAQAAVAASANLALSAREHWQQDKTRLKAIEMLQERRVEEHRAERGRAEARELDEIATQAWARASGQISGQISGSGDVA